jgi:hypothetical protein
VDDAWGPEFASQARVFLTELQRVVKMNDRARFSTLIQYPVHVFQGNQGNEIASRKEFIRRYSSIVTPDIKRAILTQSPDCLFANGQDVMIGNGQIWFQKQSEAQMKIITFNLSSSRGSD